MGDCRPSCLGRHLHLHSMYGACSCALFKFQDKAPQSPVPYPQSQLGPVLAPKDEGQMVLALVSCSCLQFIKCCSRPLIHHSDPQCCCHLFPKPPAARKRDRPCALLSTIAHVPFLGQSFGGRPPPDLWPACCPCPFCCHDANPTQRPTSFLCP